MGARTDFLVEGGTQLGAIVHAIAMPVGSCSEG